MESSQRLICTLVYTLYSACEEAAHIHLPHVIILAVPCTSVQGGFMTITVL